MMTPEEILKKLQQLIAEQFAVEEDTVTMDTVYEEDLGADSVDLVELVMAIEEEFDVGEIQEDDVPALKTVGDAVRFIAGKVNG